MEGNKVLRQEQAEKLEETKMKERERRKEGGEEREKKKSATSFSNKIVLAMPCLSLAQISA